MAEVARHRHHLADRTASRGLRRRSTIRAAVFFGSVPVAAISPTGGKYFWLLLPASALAYRLAQRVRSRA
jgi:hypothetical protein